MKECCETGVAKRKRYWHWVALGCVVLIAVVLKLIPDQIRDSYGISVSVRAKFDISTIMQSLTEYSINNDGAYPSSLVPLVMPDANGHCYLDGYNEKVPKDPWKHEYHYEPPTPAYPEPHVWSYGADGERGGTGDAADIHSDDLTKLH